MIKRLTIKEKISLQVYLDENQESLYYKNLINTKIEIFCKKCINICRFKTSLFF